MTSAFAADPGALVIHHSGRVLDANDEPLTGEHTLTVTICKGATGADAVFTDTWNLTLFNGTYSVGIGDSSDDRHKPLPASAFDGGARWIGFRLGTQELNPRIRNGAAPLAMHALGAAVAGDVKCTGCIDATELSFHPTPSDGSVTTAKLAGAAATGEKIAARAIAEGHLGDGAVAERALAAGAVTNAKLGAAAVSGEKLSAGAIAEAHLTDGAVSERALAAGSITGSKVASGAIASDALASGAVTLGKIAPGAVNDAALAAGAVTNAKLATGAVSADKLATGSVTADSIASGAIGAAKLAPGAVGTAALADGAITREKFAPGALLASTTRVEDRFEEGSGSTFADASLHRNTLAVPGSGVALPTIAARVAVASARSVRLRCRRSSRSDRTPTSA